MQYINKFNVPKEISNKRGFHFRKNLFNELKVHFTLDS
jgi:hypothetical protein